MYVGPARIGDRGYYTGPRSRPYGKDGGYLTTDNCHTRRDNPLRVPRAMVLDNFLVFLPWELIWNAMSVFRIKFHLFVWLMLGLLFFPCGCGILCLSMGLITSYSLK